MFIAELTKIQKVGLLFTSEIIQLWKIYVDIIIPSCPPVSIVKSEIIDTMENTVVEFFMTFIKQFINLKWFTHQKMLGRKHRHRAVVRLLNKDNAAPCYISSYGIMQPARPPGTFCCYSCHEAATHPVEGSMMKYISWWGHNIFSRKINTGNWNWLILRKNNICVKLQ